jgi:micrococcal nuclease
MGATRTASALILLAIPVVSLGQAETALVERVVDGDTVVVRLDGQSVKVRLIGIDAPESVDPRKPVERFAHESAAFLRRLVQGKRGVPLPAGDEQVEHDRAQALLVHQSEPWWPAAGEPSGGGQSDRGDDDRDGA